MTSQTIHLTQGHVLIIGDLKDKYMRQYVNVIDINENYGNTPYFSHRNKNFT
jgi:hypothetical protein